MKENNALESFGSIFFLEKGLENSSGSTSRVENNLIFARLDKNPCLFFKIYIVFYQHRIIQNQNTFGKFLLVWILNV